MTLYVEMQMTDSNSPVVDPGNPSVVDSRRSETLLGLTRVCLLGAPLVLGGVLGGVLGVSSVAMATSEAASDQATLEPTRNAEATSLVKGMSEALNTLNYSGTFVHILNGNVETMRILHSTDDTGGVKERMTSLNGEAREVFRDDQTVTCVWPASQSVIVSKSKPRNLIPQVEAALSDSPYYKMVLDGPDRVAGRDVKVVSVRPVDGHRYGYRFWIDSETKMLLRMMMLDEDQNALEQVMFTNIEYPTTIEQSLLAVTAEESFSWQEPAKPLKVASTAASSKVVEFEELPAGYMKISETYDAMPMGDAPVSHVTLSDGMASISVYVEYMPQEKHDAGSAGLSQMGAMNAFGKGYESAFVTVVGEVPEAVVRAIGEAVLVN